MEERMRSELNVVEIRLRRALELLELARSSSGLTVIGFIQDMRCQIDLAVIHLNQHFPK